MREKIRLRQYVMTIHAEEEMDEDGMRIFDVESIVLSGSIVERQKDSFTGKWKYIVKGDTLSESSAIVVAKLSPTGKLVIVTVFCE
jgi:hypothetical protein